MSAHRVINPAILYFGTPVVLVSTLNPDGTPNLAPISSAWWLGDRCVIGIIGVSQTTINLLRTGQCVLNLASDDMGPAVNALARTTGASPVPSLKIALGYTTVRDKFDRAGLEAVPSDLVGPPRVRECPVQMEAELVGEYPLMGDVPERSGVMFAIELKMLRVHASDRIISRTHPNRIDPDRWRPLIMSFQKLYGLTSEILPSTLAKIDEEMGIQSSL